MSRIGTFHSNICIVCDIHFGSEFIPQDSHVMIICPLKTAWSMSTASVCPTIQWVPLSTQMFVCMNVADLM